MASDKQFNAFKEITENHRSVRSAMLVAGYDEDTANKPKNLTESLGFKELVSKYLPDELLTEAHRRQFNQVRLDYFVFPKTMADDEIEAHVNAAGIEVIVIRLSDKGKMAFYSIPDSMAITKALDLAYKLKGSYAPEKSVSLHLTETIRDPALDKLRQAFNEAAKQKIIDEINNG
jgi:hypothetical protein